MPLNDIETKAIKSCCELNDTLTLNVIENDKRFIYKSRFLAVDFKRKYIVIDEPSAETPDAKPFSKGQYFEVFFQYKIFRYLFHSRVVDHTMFTMNQMKVHALRILMPKQLKDGDMREYFRVQTGMRPPIEVKFDIIKKGEKEPIMSALIPGKVEEYQGELIDISGGGFSMRAKPGEKPFELEKGDKVGAEFQLKTEFGPMKLWAEVRNIRKYKDTHIIIWGFQFLGKAENRGLKVYQNKILRYVTNRQREILSK